MRPTQQSVFRLGFVLALLAGPGVSASRAQPVMQYPGVYEYGGDNQLVRNFDLYWCQSNFFGTRTETHQGDVWLSDGSFSLYGPHIGGLLPMPNLPGVVYDDGSVRIENIRKTDFDQLWVWKYADHIHYQVRLTARCGRAAHRWIRLTVRGRRIPPTYTISGNAGAPGVTVSVGQTSTTTDASGDYSVSNLPAGSHRVSASKAGCSISPPLLFVTVGPNAPSTNFETECGTPQWHLSTIQGAPADFRPNSIWARNRNEAYVWGSSLAQGDQAILFKWDGNSWTEVLRLPNSSPITVFGTGATDVWVSTYSAPTGPSAVYRSIDRGLNWLEQSLPPEIGNNWLGSLTGTQDNVQASAGANAIVRWNGSTWTMLGAGGTTNNDAPGPMTFVSPTEGYYTTCWGWGTWNGSSWAYHPNGFDFCDVSSVFATRDATGALMFYTAGNNNFSNGVRVWAFNGVNFGGKCGYVFGDPIDGTFICNGVLAGNGSYGYATGIWGSRPDNIWVTGKLGYPQASGRVYHFDGQQWLDLTPAISSDIGESLPATTALSATAEDDIWIALADGRVFRYARNAVIPQVAIIPEISTPSRIYLTGSDFTPAGSIAIHLLDPLLGELLYNANPADSSGRLGSFGFGFGNCCAGTYYTWAVDLTSGRPSNVVTFTVPAQVGSAALVPGTAIKADVPAPNESPLATGRPGLIDLLRQLEGLAPGALRQDGIQVFIGLALDDKTAKSNTRLTSGDRAIKIARDRF